MEDKKQPRTVEEAARRIRTLLPRARLKDRLHVLRSMNRLGKKSGRKNGMPGLPELLFLEKKLLASAAEKEACLQRIPRLSFPPELPITRKSGEIIRAIRNHSVIILSGETGSGKSTQIPKMCLRAGRGREGMIACTQPRRIAAITIAHRIAHELGETLGRSVGYKIRFRDRTSPETLIKIVTDGMLLAEARSDPYLASYDTLIIDEAHERSLNIDLLLGLARTLQDTRPELKIIITSATLDTEKFSRAFRNAPVIEVSGRLYPVDVEYWPAEAFTAGADDSDYVDLAVRAVDRIMGNREPGDILVFMPTEQDILEAVDRISGKKYPGTTVLPLYARLPGTQQGRVYGVKGRKIVVATNVAETSLTIPGIRYVVDTGLARIARYQPGTGIKSLPVSPVSRSSADQRKGRCGRVRSGLCIRLYGEKEYAARPPFTPPEILRSNLAEVILRMIDLGLGRPERFPFLDPPKPAHIKDGYATLVELGAIRKNGRGFRLTAMGRIMARIPLDPRLSRMLLEARKEGCLREMAVIAAALSIRDPRERPPEKSDQADTVHASFRHPDSDFLTLLKLWDGCREFREKWPRKKQRLFCREHFLSFPRMREWMRVHDQILAVLREQRIPLGRRECAPINENLYAGIHRSILSGFLSHIAVFKEKNLYTTAKGGQAMVFPGSTLFGKSRPWIVAAEMVRTSRLFARTAARISPAWLEDLGGDLCRRSYSEVRWDKNRGRVVASERVTLYGLEIVSGRTVPYAPIRPEEAHRIFIRSALVRGEMKTPPPFVEHNRNLSRRVSVLEEKLRRRGYLIDEEDICSFYTRRLPTSVSDEQSLQAYIRARGGDGFLRMKEADLLLAVPDEKELSLFPDHLEVSGRRLALSYRFAPGNEDDGPTLEVPAPLLPRLPGELLEWGVPGYLPQKIAALLKGLPKRFRKLLVPVPEKVEVVLGDLKPGEGSLYEQLSGIIRRRFRADIPLSAWMEAQIPPYLKLRVAVLGPRGEVLQAERDPASLGKKTERSPAGPPPAEWSRIRNAWEREGLEWWDFDTLPESVPLGPFQEAYPALEPAEKGADLRLYLSEEKARETHPRGVGALLLQRFGEDLEFLGPYLTLGEEYQAPALPFGGKREVEKALKEALRRETLEKDIRSREAFNAWAESLTRELPAKSHVLVRAVQNILAASSRVRRTLREIASTRPVSAPRRAFLESMEKELRDLVPRDFLRVYSLERLEHIPRYLEALRLRAERGILNLAKDRAKAEKAEKFIRALEALGREAGDSPADSRKNAAIDAFRWMVEEYKVSLFAPELKTAHPVSEKRLLAKLKEIRTGLQVRSPTA